MIAIASYAQKRAMHKKELHQLRIECMTSRSQILRSGNFPAELLQNLYEMLLCAT